MKTTLPVSIENIIKEKQQELDKFTMINSPKSVNLDNVDTTQRKGGENFSGIGTELFSDLWFKTPKGEALYRSHPTASYNYDNIYAWNEIVCQQLCKQVDIPCANYEFAHLGSSYGLVSYNFLKPDEWLITSKNIFDNYNVGIYTNHTFTAYKKSFEQMNTDIYKFNKEEILFNLYKILIFDHITSQRDRHTTNINFICKKGENCTINLRLAPLFDNEMAFGRFSPKAFDDAINSKTPEEFCKYLYLCMFQAKTPFNEFAPTSPNNLIPEINPIWFEDEAYGIYELTKSNPKYEEYFNFLIENLNIKQCCESLEKQGLKVDDKKIVWYEKCIKTKKYFLAKAKERYDANNIIKNDSVCGNEIESQY